MDEQFDVIIVGSGPSGAAVARTVMDLSPASRVLMVEAGPQLTEIAGQSVRNLDPAARALAQASSEGPTRETSTNSGVQPRAGTMLVSDVASSDGRSEGMPAAAMSANVGGLAAHWTGACPRPGGSERIPFIPLAAMDELLADAERLLGVRADAYPDTAVRDEIERRLAERFDTGREPGRRVQHMPLAATPTEGGSPHWHGVDVILGELAQPAPPRSFELRDMTLARKIHTVGEDAVGVQLDDLRTGESSTVGARAVVIAADAFRTPQLLWNSMIRPLALGRYLNDQPQIMCAVFLEAGIESRVTTRAGADADPREALTGVSWIPFHEPDYPFHGQIMQRDSTPMLVGDHPQGARPVVSLGCFTTKEIRFQDRVWFTDTELDPWGMPGMRIDYGLTAADHRAIDEALDIVRGLADSLGKIIPGGHARVVPAGSSIHYQGSVRMGAVDDGTSVCDAWGRVWSHRNLFVAGNGVIPTPTACNPTLTAVALAVRSAREVVRLLKPAK